MSDIALCDLPMFWQGRANTLRILDSKRGQSDQATLEQAWTYEECAKELAAVLRASDEPLRVTLQATLGRVMNAKIDLQTGHTKAAGIRTLDEIIKFVDDALAQVRP